MSSEFPDSKIAVGDKVVRVRKPDFGGVWDVLEKIEVAKLPLPDLKGAEVGALLRESAEQMKDLGASASALPHMIYAAQQAASMRLQAALAEVLAANLETIRRWVFGCKPAVIQLIVSVTNLEPDEVRKLELVDTVRLFKLAWTMTAESGLVEELKSFFGGLTAAPPPKPPVTTIEPEIGSEAA